MTVHSINAMFDPGAIAFIGASEEEGSVGRSILENLLMTEGRKVYPVNPKKESAFGLTCYPAMADLCPSRRSCRHSYPGEDGTGDC